MWCAARVLTRSLILLCVLGATGAAKNRQLQHICLVSADFWGLPTAGGTATAYHLLAKALADTGSPSVTLLGASLDLNVCHEAASTFSSPPRLHFECLTETHLQPEVVDTFPYEAIGHGVLRWLKTSGQKCDVVHAHEWGGALQPVAAFLAARMGKPGVRLAVEPHGGHYWSTQGSRQRPTDVMTLRIDDHERVTLSLAEFVISPTAYMLAYLRQRGWQLPQNTSVIPNIVPGAHSQLQAQRQTISVWRLAFFGRLDERKGLKQFCSALDTLNDADLPRLEIDFIGSEAKVDMLPSKEFLRRRSAAWSFKVNILGGLRRVEALARIKSNGTLVVFSSLVENLPFVVAEACIEEVPFITFDVGGVSELFDPLLNEDVIVKTVSATSLVEKILIVLKRGWMQTTTLSPEIAISVASWQTWHQLLDSELQQYRGQDDVTRGSLSEVQTVRLPAQPSALNLKRDLCAEDKRDVLLLLPEEFASPSPKTEHLLALLGARFAHLPTVGGFIFGATLSDGRVSYATTPTYMIYHGFEALCTEDAPVLILRSTFCETYLPEARDFSIYHSWVLALHMRQSRKMLVSYSDPTFVLNNFTTAGSGCRPDRIPRFRQISAKSAANLLAPAEEVLLAQHLAPWPRPAVSLRQGFDKFQGHRGWRYNYFDTSGQLRPLNDLSVFLVPLLSWCDSAQVLLHPCDGKQLSTMSPWTACGVARRKSFPLSGRQRCTLAYP